MTKSFIEEYTQANEPQSYTLQQGRAYIHEKCHGTTVVSGDDFAWVANPFRDAPGTICCHCGPDDLKNFVWQDTGEDLESYRKRLWDQTPKGVIWLYFGVIPGTIFFAVFFLSMLVKMPKIGPLTPIAVQVGAAIIAALITYFIGLQRVTAGRERPFYTEK